MPPRVVRRAQGNPFSRKASLSVSPAESTVFEGKSAFVFVNLDPGTGGDGSPHTADGAQFALQYDSDNVEVVTTSFTVDPPQAASTTSPGNTITVGGTNFSPLRDIIISLDGEQVTDAQGVPSPRPQMAASAT